MLTIIGIDNYNIESMVWVVTVVALDIECVILSYDDRYRTRQYLAPVMWLHLPVIV